MEGGIVFTRARRVILDIANELKTVIFPLSDRFLALYSFNTFSIFYNVLFEILIIFKLFIV